MLTLFVGNLLLKRLLEAIPKAKECRADFKAFDEALRAEIPDEVVAAEQAINAWDADHTLPDPYLVPKSSKYPNHVCFNVPHTITTEITLQEVRLMMAEEEKKQVEEGTSVTREVGESAAIVMGMEIQNTQCVSLLLISLIFLNNWQTSAASGSQGAAQANSFAEIIIGRASHRIAQTSTTLPRGTKNTHAWTRTHHLHPSFDYLIIHTNVHFIPSRKFHALAPLRAHCP